MSPIKTAGTILGISGEIIIHFYQINGMPALILEGDNHQIIDDLTTNHHQYLDGTVTLRSDQPENISLLQSSGWIEHSPIIRIPSGFITIDYYPLTKEALKIIKRTAKDQGENYPREE